MIFNGVDLSPYLRIKAIRGRNIAGNELSLISVPGMSGAHLSKVHRPPRVLEIEADVIANNKYELRHKIDELNTILDVEEAVPIVFPDEADMTYYGLPESTGENNEFPFMHQGVITIVCPDPYKYSEEIAVSLNDVGTVNNDGAAETSPVFELEVLEPVTYAMIQKGDTDKEIVIESPEYQMIGRPGEDDVQIVNQRELVFAEEGQGIDEWSYSPVETDPPSVVGIVSNGTMAFDGTGIIADDYGDPHPDYNGYGPAIIRELPQTIQDFELTTVIDTRTDLLEENFRVELYLFDEGFNNLGKIGIRDGNRGFHNRRGLARVGHYVDSSTRYMIGSSNYNYNDFGKSSMFFFRWKRVENQFEFYLARVVNGKHQDTMARTFTDVNYEWTGRLRYVQIYIRNFKGRQPPYLARVNNIYIYRLHEETVDQTPYIAYPGDTITLDHVNDEMLINGEDRTDLKDFGGRYFQLDRGENQLIIMPFNSFNTTMKYRERRR